MVGKILLNAVRCDTCKRVLVSQHVHDYRSCDCGVFVDGGREYLRRGMSYRPDTTFTDLSLVLVGDVIKMASDVEED